MWVRITQFSLAPHSMIDHKTSDTSDQRQESADQITHQFTFDPKTDSSSETLIGAIATVNTIDPTDRVIFSDFVDPETQ
jgi:hypothetical protein